MATTSTSRALYRSYTRSSPAAWAAQALHQEAWKRSTRTFLPMSKRESQVLPSCRTVTRTAGAAGGAAATGAWKESTTSAAAARLRITPHSIPGERAMDVLETVESASFSDLYWPSCLLQEWEA